jgi:hypothetical protein
LSGVVGKKFNPVGTAGWVIVAGGTVTVVAGIVVTPPGRVIVTAGKVVTPPGSVTVCPGSVTLGAVKVIGGIDLVTVVVVVLEQPIATNATMVTRTASPIVDLLDIIISFMILISDIMVFADGVKRIITKKVKKVLHIC